MDYKFDYDDVKRNLSQDEFEVFSDNLYRNAGAIFNELELNGDFESPLAIKKVSSTLGKSHQEKLSKMFRFEKIYNKIIKVTKVT